MSRLATLIASHNICGRAVFCLMTNLVTLKTHFFSTLVTIMRVFPAEYATWFLSRIGTLLGMMPKLQTIVTLYRDVLLGPITPGADFGHLINQGAL